MDMYWNLYHGIYNGISSTFHPLKYGDLLWDLSWGNDGEMMQWVDTGGMFSWHFCHEKHTEYSKHQHETMEIIYIYIYH